METVKWENKRNSRGLNEVFLNLILSFILLKGRNDFHNIVHFSLNWANHSLFFYFDFSLVSKINDKKWCELYFENEHR